MKRVFIQLGGNRGEWSTIRSEVIRLLDIKGVQIVQTSSTYLTEPWGMEDQADYHNEVWQLDYPGEAGTLLQQLLDIERALGRDRQNEMRWGPRVIDLDILLIDNEVIKSDQLEVPHPRMHMRRFVLEPLAEIAPSAFHPILQLTAEQLLNDCPDQGKVERQ